MSLGWTIFIIFAIGVTLIGGKIAVQLVKYQSTKNRFKNASKQFIEVSFEEINLSMEDSLNNFLDIEENLSSVKDIVVSEKRKEEIEDAIELVKEFRIEYNDIKNLIGKKEFRNSESLKDIRDSINDFRIRLNNDLAVRVRQLVSKIRKEQKIK